MSRTLFKSKKIKFSDTSEIIEVADNEIDISANITSIEGVFTIDASNNNKRYSFPNEITNISNEVIGYDTTTYPYLKWLKYPRRYGEVVFWYGEATYSSNAWRPKDRTGTLYDDWYICAGGQTLHNDPIPNMQNLVPVGILPVRTDSSDSTSITDTFDNYDISAGNISASQELTLSKHTHEIKYTSKGELNDISANYLLYSDNTTLNTDVKQVTKFFNISDAHSHEVSFNIIDNEAYSAYSSTNTFTPHYSNIKKGTTSIDQWKSNNTSVTYTKRTDISDFTHTHNLGYDAANHDIEMNLPQAGGGTAVDDAAVLARAPDQDQEDIYASTYPAIDINVLFDHDNGKGSARVRGSSTAGRSGTAVGWNRSTTATIIRGAQNGQDDAKRELTPIWNGHMASTNAVATNQNGGGPIWPHSHGNGEMNTSGAKLSNDTDLISNEQNEALTCDIVHDKFNKFFNSTKREANFNGSENKTTFHQHNLDPNSLGTNNKTSHDSTVKLYDEDGHSHNINMFTFAHTKYPPDATESYPMYTTNQTGNSDGNIYYPAEDTDPDIYNGGEIITDTNPKIKYRKLHYIIYLPLIS